MSKQIGSIGMAKTAQIQIRLDTDLKVEAEGILRTIGLSPTEFMRMSLRQLVMCKGLPFTARIPNQETVEAINESRGDLPVYTDPHEMMRDILAESE